MCNLYIGDLELTDRSSINYYSSSFSSPFHSLNFTLILSHHIKNLLSTPYIHLPHPLKKNQRIFTYYLHYWLQYSYLNVFNHQILLTFSSILVLSTRPINWNVQLNLSISYSAVFRSFCILDLFLSHVYSTFGLRVDLFWHVEFPYAKIIMRYYPLITKRSNLRFYILYK